MGLHIGVIGAGGAVAGAHLSAYADNDRVTKISLAELRLEALNRFANSPKVFKLSTDYRELIEEPSVDIIDICLPHYLHCPVSLEALEAGKAVIVEKPIAMNLQEADEMIATSKRTGKPIFVVQNQRFMPANIKAKELLLKGYIGKPFLAIFTIIGNEFARMNDPRNWKGSWEKAGGGAFIDTGIHMVYLLEHFFGNPKAVSATMRRLIVEPETKADDNSIVAIEFANGVLAVATVTYTALAHTWQERREVYGTAGSIHIDDNSTTPLVVIKDNQKEVIDIETPKELYQFSMKQCLSYYIECFIEAKVPIASAIQARSALRTALAAYESAKAGMRIELG